MRPLFLLALAAGCGGGCTTPAPAPTPQPAPTVSGVAAVVLGELVEAGCVSPADDGALEAVTLEHNAFDQPAWLGCLFDGGTIVSCQVPSCAPSSPASLHTLRTTP